MRRGSTSAGVETGPRHAGTEEPAPTAEAAFDALAAFTESPWGKKYPQAARVWEQAWDDFTPFLAFPPLVRKMLYTTNSIESLNFLTGRGNGIAR